MTKNPIKFVMMFFSLFILLTLLYYAFLILIRKIMVQIEKEAKQIYHDLLNVNIYIQIIIQII